LADPVAVGEHSKTVPRALGVGVTSGEPRHIQKTAENHEVSGTIGVIWAPK